MRCCSCPWPSPRLGHRRDRHTRPRVVLAAGPAIASVPPAPPDRRGEESGITPYSPIPAASSVRGSRGERHGRTTRGPRTHRPGPRHPHARARLHGGRVGGEQLPPAPRRHLARRGCVGDGRRGAALPRRARRLLRPQLRPPPPDPRRRGPPPARPAHPDEPRLPQRPARPLLPRPRDPREQAARAADEHRRRGGRDRDQDGPPVGLRGQGRARRPGPHRRRWPATSTAARRRSSASPTTRSPTTTTGPTLRASTSCPSATSPRSRRRSPTRRSPCSSSRSRARAVSSCRRTAGCARCAS